MGWDKLSSRKLRKLLNWNPRQMSARLALDEEYYLKLESGEELFSKEICVQLDILQMSIDKHIHRLKIQPSIDQFLKEQPLEQVETSEFDDTLLEFNKFGH